MKDLSNLTDEQLDEEIEAHKTPTEKILEEWAYNRELNREKLKRFTQHTIDKGR